MQGISNYFPILLTIPEDQTIEREDLEFEGLVNLVIFSKKRKIKELKFKEKYDGSKLQTIYENWKRLHIQTERWFSVLERAD